MERSGGGARSHLRPARPRRGIWTGDWSLPRDRQGLLVLGTPLGTDEYVHGVLAAKRAEHERLLTRIPGVPNLQAAWLLLHCCAASRANYLLRNVPPALTAQVACGLRRHYCDLLGLVGSLVHSGDQLPTAAVRTSQVALGFGGLGLARQPPIAVPRAGPLGSMHCQQSVLALR